MKKYKYLMRIIIIVLGLWVAHNLKAQVGNNWEQVLKNDKEQLAFLDELYRNIQGFAQKQVEILANESIDEWLGMPYSRLSEEKIDQLISKYSVGKDNNLRQKRAQLEKLRSDLFVYQEAVQSVNEEYNEEKVKRLAAQVRQIQTRTDEQKVEVDVLRQQLENYGTAYHLFCQLKNKIEDETKDVKFGKKEIAETIIKSMDNNNQMIIQQIPWLKGQYSQLKNIK